MRPLTLIVVLVIACCAIYVAARLNRSSRRPPFVPDPENGKRVIVRGWTENELARILGDFRKMYEDRLGPDFFLEIHVLDGGAIRVTFPHDIPAMLFSFLINYVQYPKDFDLRTRSIVVVGEAPLSADFQPPVQSLVGRSAVFYVPSNDQDYDLVYVRIGNETFVNSFAADSWKRVTDPRIPPGLEIAR